MKVPVVKPSITSAWGDSKSYTNAKPIEFDNKIASRITSIIANFFIINLLFLLIADSTTQKNGKAEPNDPVHLKRIFQI